MDRRTARAPLTLALELLGGGGEQQLAFHVRGPSAAGDAWLLVPRLDPAGEPAQVAAAVQGVGPNGSAGGGRVKLHPLPSAGNWAQRPWDGTGLGHLAGLLHFQTNQRYCLHTQPHTAAQLDDPPARAHAMPHGSVLGLSSGCPHRNSQGSLSSTPEKLPGPSANQAKHLEAVQKQQDHCTGAAGPAWALPHKPAGQGHGSRLLGTSSGSRPELVGTALGESKELL